jgi:glycogen debranching enzyme
VNRLRHFLCVAPCATVLLLGCATHPTAPEALRFSVPDGRVLNEFYRQGPVAAHIVLTSGATPRIVFAFPAGNSGAAVWFDARSDAFAWAPDVTIAPSSKALPEGSVMHGVTAELIATGGSVTIREAILSSVRVIRDRREDAERTTPEVLVQPQVSERAVNWERRRLDGAAGYALSINVQRGTLARNDAGAIILSPAEDGRLQLRVTALTGDTPLTPFPRETLFTSSAGRDARLRDILAFLAYEEKLLAGSWRFNTYFGRDTLMSVRLLTPVLKPPAIEAGLGAVLERMSEHGEVAHEEDIGEFAVLRRRHEALPADSAPIFDYKMIDDDFMLPVVAAHYLLDTSEGRERAPAFLARKADSGEAYGSRLVSNLRFVLGATRSFAREPDWRHLVPLKHESVGNWRDSNDGLGGGRYPYDVNGVFAPAALAGIARLHASGVLRPYLEAADDELLSQSAGMAEVWRREAPRLFDASFSSGRARAEVEAYARRTGVEAGPALRAIGDDGVRFRAVALDAQGHAIPIMNSDEGFSLLFLDAEPAETARVAEALTRPFPAGLLTDVGLLVADPAYANDEIEPRFDRNRYHGTVIWSWQQEVLAAGIERQLARSDVAGAARETLLRARAKLRTAMSASDAMRGSELWSWSQVEGRYRLEPFGQRSDDETESNAAQLWSTVHLARPGN